MTTKHTYNPEDIESLLTTKVYDDLLPEEKEFVMQHIDSKDEYTLLRTTLLAIKKSSENDELIEANPKTKEELLLLMESKNRRGAGWFNLNGLWSFLFPSDVFFTRKPGFQLASFAMLLFVGFYFGGQFLNFESNNLAINKPIPKVEEVVIDKVPVEQEEVTIPKKQSIVVKDIETTKLNGKDDAEAESIDLNQINEDVFAEEVSEEKIVDGNTNNERVENTAANSTSISGGLVLADELMDDFSQKTLADESTVDAISSKSVSTNLNRVVISTDINGDKLRDASVSKVKTKSLQSQSLADDEPIIDLLYITL